MKTIHITLIIFISSITNSFSQGTWQLVTTVQPAPRVDDIFFTNDSVGYFAKNTVGIFKTTDKGNTWNMIAPVVPHSDYFRSIEFINDTIGFFGMISSGGAPLNGAMYKTVDGGYTWNQLQNMQMLPYDGICGIAHYNSSVIAVGTYSTPARFYRSDDAGLSWINKDMSAFASGLVDCYMFNHDTIIVSGIGDASVQNKATILKSFDGGLTWQRVFTASVSTSYCWKMFFRPNGVGLASVQGGSVIARSTDFGTTWTEIAITNPLGYNFGAIGLMNDTLGWVADQDIVGMWETHDAGLTWNTKNTIVEAGDRMVVIDSVTALISGAGIYKYVNGVTGIQNPIAANYGVHDLIIYPNPVSENINVEAIASNNTFGLLDILNEDGVLVQSITRQGFAKGKNVFNVSVKGLAAGNYKILWRNNEHFISKSFVIIK